MTSRLQTLLHDYVAGDLDEARVAEVEKLLAGNAKARTLHGEILRAHEALVTLRDRPTPAVTAEDALPRIRAAIAADAFRPRPKLYLDGEGTRFYRRLAMAALLLFAVSIGLLGVNRFARNGAEPDPAGVATRPPEPDVRPGIYELILKDGRVEMSAEELLDLYEQAGVTPEEAYITPNDLTFPVSANRFPKVR